MKTSIVDVAVRGQSVGSALKSGAYTVAGTGLCGLGSVLDTVANVGQKVVDMTRAAGEACTEKGEEFLAEAAKLKGEEPAKKEEKVEKQEASQQEQAAPKQQKSSKTWTLAKFVAKYNEFAEAATAINKEFTKVIFRAEGSVKGVVAAFDAVRRSDGANCSIFADMAKVEFSVVAPPKKAEKSSPKKEEKAEAVKPAKKAPKKAAAPAKKADGKKEEKPSKKAVPVKETVKAEPAKEESSMKAALEAARTKKAAKTKTAKTEPAKTEKSSKKADGKKEPYSSTPKADMALEEAVRDHGEWLDKVIRHFQGISTKPLANVAVKSNYLKFSSYRENGQDDAVSVAFKSHKVKVNRKEVKLDL